MKETENQIQAQFFRFCDGLALKHPEIELIHSIPNGTYKSKFARNLYKQTGLKSGVPDVMLPVARCGFHGLYIEFKSEKGRLSPTQKWWIPRLMRQKFFVGLCRDSRSAADLLTAYIEDDFIVFAELADNLKVVPDV